MLWVLSFLPPPAYYALVGLFIMAAFYLFNDDISDIITDMFGDNKLSDAFDAKASFFFDGLNFLECSKRGRKKKCHVSFNSTKRRLDCVETKISFLCSKKTINRNFYLENLEKIEFHSDNLSSIEQDSAVVLTFAQAPTPLVLVAGNADIRNSWVKDLQIQLIKLKPQLCQYKNDKKNERLLANLNAVVDEKDKNEKVSFSVDLIQKVLKKYNINASKSDLKLYAAKKLNIERLKPDGLTFNDIQVVVKSIVDRKDLSDIFDQFALSNSNYTLMSVIDFHSFITDVQQQSLTMDECWQILPQDDTLRHNYLLINSTTFHDYLNAGAHNALTPEALAAPEKLDYPLSDYFISSSHNTYLLEDQLKGRSDCSAYENALRKNCRCVELDIHNGSNGDPIITHGGTMTSKIRFEDVIKTIAKYAFVASKYPVILSFENHTGIDQQKKMVEYLNQHLGDYLYLDENADSFQKLPSPEQLKNKIIIKNKKLSQSCFMEKEFAVVEEEFEEEGDVEDTEAVVATEGIDVEQDDLPSALPNFSTAPVLVGNVEIKKKATKTTSLAEFVAKKLSSNSKKLELSKELSNCVTICRAVKFKGCSYAKDNYKCTEMSSLVESKLNKKHWSGETGNETGNDFVLHSQYQLVRTYPLGIRTNSSNYNPCLGWIMGCQLVALNYQTPATPMDLNNGLFQLQGGTGYVLKPKLLRDPQTTFNPFGPCYDPQLARKIDLKIISAFNISSEKDDKQLIPYVKVYVFGVADDEKKDATKKADIGINPEWNHECFANNTNNPNNNNALINVPDLAHLRLEVRDKTRDKIIGQFCAPLTAYAQGYRLITLLDYKGNSTQSELLIRLKLTPIVAENQ